MLRAEASSYICAGGANQVAKSCDVQLSARVQFHVPHPFATPLQQAGGILEQCAVEKAYVDMTFECVDVPERRIFYARDRTTIVHQFPDIVTALPHLTKPLLRDRTQLERAVGKPGVDSRISFYCSGDPKDVLPTRQSAEVQRNSKWFMSAHDAQAQRR
jgi:hypothetical protein